MRRWIFSALIVAGAGFMLTGMLLMASDARAQDSAPDYVGSRECSSCHGDIAQSHEEARHALALQDVSRRKDGIIADFDSGEDVRTVTFPDDDEARAFDEDDVVYAIGSGRYMQRYLVEIDRNQYALLPAEWNSVTGEWQAYGPVDEWPGPAYDFVTNCAGCHTTGLDVERTRWEDDGVQCESCHGPGEAHVDAVDDAGRDPDDEDFANIRASIVLSPDAQICGQCHSQGVATGSELPFTTEYRPGATLTDSFTLTPPDDSAHFWPTGHAAAKNEQYNEWASSAHATALTTMSESDNAADACLSCHSADAAFSAQMIARAEAGDREGAPPFPATLETAQSGVTCVSCHDPHAEETDFSLRAEPYALCTSCHSDANVEGIHHPVQEMYEGQTVVSNIEALPSSHFTDENGPDCMTCHMERVPISQGTRASHALYPVLPGEAANIDGLDAACTTCHEAQVDDIEMQALIDDVQTNTQARLETAAAAITPTSADWVTTALAFVQGDGSRGIHNYAYTDRLLDAIEAELGLDR